MEFSHFLFGLLEIDLLVKKKTNLAKRIQE